MTGMLEQSDIEQLDRSWKVIKSLWYSFVGSLAVYLFLCKFMEDELQPMENIVPLTTLKRIIFCMAILVLFAANYARKVMLNTDSSDHALSSKVQNPAAGKYITAMIVAMGLSESIGVAGVVLFYLFKDSATLYQFLIFSSMAMFYFRPRKEELLQIAVEMKKKSNRMQVGPLPAGEVKPWSGSAGRAI